MCGTCVGAPLGGVASVCLGALVCVFGRRSHLELLESLRACFHRLHPTQRALALKVLPDDPKRVLAKVVIGEAIGGAEELAAEAERRGGRHTLTHYPLLCCDPDLRDSSTPSRLSRGARARGVICGPWNSDDGGREASYFLTSVDNLPFFHSAMDTEAPPSSATPPDEQQKGKCLELVSGALARCPRVRELQQALEGLGSTVPIDCVQCPEGPDGNPAAAGGFLPDTNSVVLCQQWVTANPSEVCVCGCAQHLFFAPLGDEAVRPPPAQELGLPRVSCIAAFLLHVPTPLPYPSDTPPPLVSPHDLPTISPRSPHGLPTVSPTALLCRPITRTAPASRVYLKLYLKLYLEGAEHADARVRARLRPRARTHRLAQPDAARVH